MAGPRCSGMSSSLGASVLAVWESGDVAGVESEGLRIGLSFTIFIPSASPRVFVSRAGGGDGRADVSDTGSRR